MGCLRFHVHASLGEVLLLLLVVVVAALYALRVQGERRE